MVAGYIKSSESTVAALCIAVAFYGFAFSAYMVNPMDIAPRYSDTIIGVSNALATVPGFVGPAIVGVVTKHRVSVFAYNYTFYLSYLEDHINELSFQIKSWRLWIISMNLSISFLAIIFPYQSMRFLKIPPDENFGWIRRVF